MCYLLRIERNVGAEGTPLDPVCITTLDRDVTYNDGDGSYTYSAVGGFNVSNLSMTSDLSVDNAEAQILLATGGPVTEDDINAGLYDSATYKLYRVIWSDLTTGRHELVKSGTIGQARVVGGLSVFSELRGLSQKLKQTVCEKWSLTCRAQFGSTTGRFPCNYNIAPEWITSLTVTAVGSETDREFTAAALAVANNYLVPGVVEWLTGDNAGRTFEIEAQTGDDIDLIFPTAFPIQVGDTLRVRRDCGKTYAADCVTKFSNGLNFRGEPHIPVADESAMASGAAGPQPNSGDRVQDVLDAVI